MSTKNTFSVLPIIRKSRTNKAGEAPIYIRITVNKQIAELSSKHYIEPKLWDSSRARVSGKTNKAKSINNDLEKIELSCRNYYNQLLTSKKNISAIDIKNLLLGQEEQQNTLLFLFDKMVEEVKSLVGKDYTGSTYKTYLASQRKIHNYVQAQYGEIDINLKDLDYKFIANYELYLKTSGGCNQNGCIKHMQKLRKVITKALDHEYLDKDPFLRYSIKKKKTVVQPLTKYELLAIEKKKFTIERLNTIRDIFLFTCYTGLAFSDAALLKKENIRLGIDGEEWIFIFRKKTGSLCRIPLLTPAKAILTKFKDHPKVQGTDKLLPVPSNQKFNAYLKEIADLCGINKRLTVHIGRHTFATTVALQNGIPMDVVKEILGHGNITTTQIYAKVSDERIASAIKHLRKKL
jgi:site-specific recombinase XerD